MKLSQIKNNISQEEQRFLNFCEKINKIIKYKAINEETITPLDFDGDVMDGVFVDNTNIFHFIVKQNITDLFFPVIKLFAEKYGEEKACSYIASHQYGSTNGCPLIVFMLSNKSVDNLLDLGEFVAEYMPLELFYQPEYKRGQGFKDDDKSLSAFGVDSSSHSILTLLSESLSGLLLDKKNMFNKFQKEAAFNIIKTISNRGIGWEKGFINIDTKEPYNVSSDVSEIKNMGIKIQQYNHLYSISGKKNRKNNRNGVL